MFPITFQRSLFFQCYELMASNVFDRLQPISNITLFKFKLSPSFAIGSLTKLPLSHFWHYNNCLYYLPCYPEDKIFQAQLGVFPAPDMEWAISLRSLVTFSKKWYFKTINRALRMLIAVRLATVSRRVLGNLYFLVR